jgi:hypothetical protein
MTTLIATWLLTGSLSCLIAVVSQRQALQNLALGIIRFDLIQALIAAAFLALLFIAGPIGLAFIFIWFLITRKI